MKTSNDDDEYQKTKLYTVVKNWEIVGIIKNGKSKGSLSRKCRILEVASKKETNYVHFSVPWKRTRLCKKMDFDEYLCKWFIQNHNEGVLMNGGHFESSSISV